MATRIGFQDDEFQRVDALATAEQDPQQVVQNALQLAAGGDDFELEMLSSGFYDDLIGGGLDAVVTPHVAIRVLGDFLIDKRERAVERRWGHDENTLLNFAFRAGHHYVEVDKARRAVVEVPAPKDFVRRTIHKFHPWFQATLSKKVQARPEFTAQAKSEELVDRDAAIFIEKLIRLLDPDTWDLPKRAQIAMWELLGGMMVYHIGVDYVETDDYLIAGGEPMRMPVLRRELFPPQQVWCDADIPTIEEMRWFGVDRYVTTAKARAIYPERLSLIDPDNAFADRGLSVLKRIADFSGAENPFVDTPTEGGLAYPEEEEGEAETMLCQYWLDHGEELQLPNLDMLNRGLEHLGQPPVPMEVVVDGEPEGQAPVVRFPQGLRVTFTPDGDVLEVVANPLGPRLPFYELAATESPGFYRVAAATALRPIQMAYNWIHNMREMHGMKVSNPPLLVPRDARVHRRKTVLGSLSRLLYKANRFGAKPEFMNMPTWPSDMVQFQQELDRSWQEIGAFHDPTQGQLPSGEISGIAISLLQEADLSQHGFSGEKLEDAARKILLKQLQFIQRFYPQNDPRLMDLAGTARYQLAAFMQADLGNGVDVGVVAGSFTPKSPAALQAQVKEAWAMGALIDRFGRPDHKRVMQVFGLGNPELLYQEEETDINNARMAQEMMLQMPPDQALMAIQLFMQTGELPPPLGPRPEDDHLVHEAEFRSRLKQLQSDPRAHPISTELMRIRWRLHALAVAPLLMQTDPDVVMSALGPAGLMGGQRQGGGQGPEGGGEAPPNGGTGEGG